MLRRGRCVLSYTTDDLIVKIDALVSGASSLSAAADSIGTIQNGTDMVVENFDHVESVLDKLSEFLEELRDKHFYTPVGALMPFAGTEAWVPAGWIVCKGQSFGTAGASSDLQSLLGAAGFSTIPDLQGRVIAGVDLTGFTDANTHPTRLRPVSGNAANLGNVIGDSRLQAHTHTITDPGHSHSYQIGGTSLGITNSNDRPARANVGTSDPNFGGINGNTTGITGTNTHNQNQGSAANVQPTMMLNYIIKN